MAKLLLPVLTFLVAAVSPSLLQSGSAEDGYICSDGRLIPHRWICDTFVDCPDEADESNCGPGCGEHEFECRTGYTCIPYWQTCNGQRDCRDGSDESASICLDPDLVTTCSSDFQFTCASGQCISAVYQCDGDLDCRDGSDEVSCGPTETPSCADNQFMCDDGLCIPEFYVCDGQQDCPGVLSVDEMECDGMEQDHCGQGFFNCSNGKCINVHQVCDHDNQCGDMSDEEDCPAISCEYSEFQCVAEGVLACLPIEYICDGEGDCDDDSDESSCTGNCADTQFQCTTSGLCISLSFMCNGLANCNDSSDEYVCPLGPPRISCHGNQFSCSDGQQCLDSSMVCDGTPHCIDQSDEARQLCTPTNLCGTSNGGCQHDCHQLSSDHTFCSCRPGYQLNATDLKSCHDINECDHPDRCSQLCTNTDRSYACSCAEGYRQTTSGECKAGGSEAELLFANRVDLRMVSLDGSRGEILVDHLQYAVSVDYHYQLGCMFWTDLYGDDIRRANLDGSNMTVLISTGLSAPDGLAVDWVNDKLYWTDAGKSRLEVANIDGSNRLILFSRDVNKPRAIVVDPASGFIFWTDWGEKAKIERSSMDGTNRITLHTEHLTWPNALTIDIPTSTLYWADAKLHIIESSDIHGRNRRPVLTLGVLHPFAITVFENRLFWTDWNTRSIVSITKSVVGANLTLVEDAVSAQEYLLTQNITDVQLNLFHPTDLHVLHPVLQPASPNPCRDDNRGCEYLCLISSESADGYKCACPTGRRLMEDGRGCEWYDTFLIFVRRMELRVISLDVPEINDVTLPVTNLTGAAAVDTDPLTDKMFWTDKSRDIISSANIDGSNQTILIDSDLENPDGLSVDYLSRKLYWTNDGAEDTIEVSEMDGTNRLILIRQGIDRPSDIVVHASAGLMFWSEWGSTPKIQRANLDGTEVVNIVHRDIIRPIGLALDLDLDRLYWCDAERDVIEYVDLNGHGRSLVIKGLNHPYGLVVHGDFIYWTDLVSGVLQVINKTSGDNIMTLADDLDIVLDVEVYSRQTARLAHPCDTNNGGCSHLCLGRPSTATPGQLEASCACPTGLGIMEDDRTCFSEIQNYILFPAGLVLHQISLDTPILAGTTQHFSHFTDVSSVAVDLTTSEVYWTERLESKIFKAPISENPEEINFVDNVTEVVSLDLITPEVIVLDWIGRTIYWADSGTGFIEVMDIESGNRRVLVKGIVQVLSLALDVLSHTLYYIDGGGNSLNAAPKIERVAMDGTNRTTIATHQLGQPRSIVVDHSPGHGTGRIYWTDAQRRRIESSALDGSNRRIVIEFPHDTGIFPFGMAVTSDHVYWTDTGHNTLSRWARDGMSSVEVVATGLVDVGHMIVVQKSQLEKKAIYSHPCDVSRHCSHLCLPNLSEEGYTCSCPTGIQLYTSTRCKNVPEHFVLFASGNRLQQVMLDEDTTSTNRVVVTLSGDFHSPIAIDHVLWSEEDGSLFFSDAGRGVISTMKMDGTGLTDILEVGASSGIAVDWVGKLIYWTDELNNTIEAARLDGTGRKVLIDRGLDEPRGITLHPRTGLMFWTDWGSRPGVFRSRMDGSSMVPIVTRNIRWPNGITLDSTSMLLYWVDAWHDQLETSDINGLFRRTFIANNLQNLHHSFGVNVQGGYVYWTDWFRRALFRRRIVPNTNDSEIESRVVNSRDRPYGFTVVDVRVPRPGELSNRRDNGPCSTRNGGCESGYLCLPIDRIRRTCGCPDDSDDSCVEYEGLRGQPRPAPAVIQTRAPPTSPILTTTRTTPAPGDITSFSPAPSTPSDLTAEPQTHVLIGTSPLPSSNRDADQGDAVAIAVSLVMIIVVVVTALFIIILLSYCWLQKKEAKFQLQRRRSLALRKLQFSNPNYVTMSAREQQLLDRESSAGSGDSLLPKTQNTAVATRKVAPPTTTPIMLDAPPTGTRDSNIYIEEPDVFIIPGQKAGKKLDLRLDSPPLKKPQFPESPPLKEPQLPESPPLKPPTTQEDSGPKAVPPVPPKTYIKVEMAAGPEAETTGGVALIPAEVPAGAGPREPKQSNIERARIVRFHPDSKKEEMPPPLPQRGLPPRNAPMTVATPKATVVRETRQVPLDEAVVSIVDSTSGNKLGEIIPTRPPPRMVRRETPPLVRQPKAMEEEDDGDEDDITPVT